MTNTLTPHDTAKAHEPSCANLLIEHDGEWTEILRIAADDLA